MARSLKWISTIRLRSRAPFLAVCLATVTLCASRSARAATITVNSTSDTAADDGACTLREAILAANTNTPSGAMAGECGAGTAGLDSIVFAIPGAGVKTITPAMPLPPISEALSIDGTTQTGALAGTSAFPGPLNAVLVVQISGLFGSFTVTGAGTTIRGLVINGNGNDAILVSASNVTIAGNFFGTNPAGTAAVAGTLGYAVRTANGSANNVIVGGPNPADRNLISGGSQGGVIAGTNTGLVIQGNFIGTDAAGTAAIAPPASQGLNNLNNAMIVQNVVSGQSGGATFADDNVVFFGNLIGTQRDGVTPLPNGNIGISLTGNNCVVGGSGAGQPNVVAFTTGGAGVAVSNLHSGNLISRNSITGHTLNGISLNFAAEGIPLANDACDVDVNPGNHGQNYPVLTSALIAGGSATITGTLNSVASTTYRLEFFSNTACGASGFGQGQTFLGFLDVATDATCNASFTTPAFAIPPGQTVVTATATDPANNTSEFSACFSAAAGPTPTPTPTPTGTPVATPTPTSTLTPTVGGPTPTPGPGSGTVAVPTLAPGLMALFGAALAVAGLLALRRSG